MRLRGYILAIGVCVAALCTAQASAAGSGRECPVTAQAVYAVDNSNGKVLCAKNARMKLYPPAP